MSAESVLADWIEQVSPQPAKEYGGKASRAAATSLAIEALAALRSAGFQVFKPEDCEVTDYMAGTYFLVPDDGPADSGGSG